MEHSKITSALKERLEKYSQTEVYKLNNYPKDIVNSIFIAMNLAEIAERNSSKIRNEDRFWFNGDAQITRLFDDDEWEDVAALYSQFVANVKENLF